MPSHYHQSEEFRPTGSVFDHPASKAYLFDDDANTARFTNNLLRMIPAYFLGAFGDYEDIGGLLDPTSMHAQYMPPEESAARARGLLDDIEARRWATLQKDQPNTLFPMTDKTQEWTGGSMDEPGGTLAAFMTGADPLDLTRAIGPLALSLGIRGSRAADLGRGVDMISPMMRHMPPIGTTTPAGTWGSSPAPWGATAASPSPMPEQERLSRINERRTPPDTDPPGLLDRATDTQKAKWASQAATAERIAGKRNKKTGQYAGAPKTVTSPQKRTALVNQYVRRVEDAIENNVDPGYFYEEGEQAIREFSDPGQAMRNANLVGLTSSQVGPRDNMMYFGRGLEQRNMIGPEGVSTMLYPNKERPNFNTLYEGGDHWLGYKRDRYANLLTPEEARPFDLPEGSLLAPNDRWEGRAAGFKGPPSGELQVSWNDEIRDRAMEKINARRAERGERPLKVKEVQELHWAQIRAEDEGRLPTIRPEDTIGGSTDRLMYQHAWESMPGSRSGHLPEIGGEGNDRLLIDPRGMEGYADDIADPMGYHTRMRGLLEDAEGKDKLVRAMGSEVQRPMYSHLGEFEGQFAPGTTSQSLISQTDSAGLLPQSQARVRATEGVRGFMLGQDATAGRVFSPLSNPDQKFNAARYETPMMDEGTFRAIKAATHARLGDDAVVVSGQGGVDIFLPGGADKKARDALEDLDDEIFNITGSHGLKGNMQGHYDELPWMEPTGRIRAFRGQHGEPGEGLLQGRDPTYAFAGDIETANLYATSPNNWADNPVASRVIPADLEMKKTLGDPDDPFFDLQMMQDAIGKEKLQDVLSRDGQIREAIEFFTDSHQNIQEKYGLDLRGIPYPQILDEYPQHARDIYGQAWSTAQSDTFIDALKAEGYDSLAMGGYGENSGLPEYHIFDESQVHWPQKGATETMLGLLDDPAAPRLVEHADSPAMRELAGEFAAEYRALQDAGMSPNQDLMRVLQTWKDEGLEGVRRLVEQGLAPALVLGVLGAGASQFPSGETAEPSLL